MTALVAALVISIASHAAGAPSVAIGLQTAYGMQCGWPGPQIDVVFPAAERLPAHIARTSVLVNGVAPASVVRTGRTISIVVARPEGVMCHSITLGVARIAFTRAAHIGNPLKAGTYSIAVRHGSSGDQGRFTVH